jgi:signal peptidase I
MAPPRFFTRRVKVLLGLLVALFVLFRVAPFQFARVQGGSMRPTLANGDLVIVNKLSYRWSDPARGDIVMLMYPMNPDKTFVERVIGEEGDQIQIVNGRVSVNGVSREETFVTASFRSHDDWGPQMIPDGYYFVMGDCRNNSSDSRHWGFVPKKYILGRIALRVWPLANARLF